MRKLLPIVTCAATVVTVSLADATSTAKASNGHNWNRLVYSCESRGSSAGWYTNTGNGYYFGPQFTRSTWHAEGGGPVLEMGDRYGKPMRFYSISYITRIAENTLRDQGYGAWPNCSGYL